MSDLAAAVQAAFRQSSPAAPFDPRRPAWHQDAACLGLDPAIFFPEKGDDTTAAKAICAGCGVRRECLDWALTNGEKFGVFGGLSENQRKKIRPRRLTNGRLAEQERTA